MTEKELRIAKLSKLLNTSIRDQKRNSHIYSDTYNRVISDLQKTLDSQRKQNQLYMQRLLLKDETNFQQKALQESMRRHHFNVLQKQIDDRRKMRELNRITEPGWKTPPQQVLPDKQKMQQQLKQALDEQILEKQKIRLQEKRKEDSLDNIRVQQARKHLQHDISTKELERKAIRDQLVNHWEQLKTTKDIQKNIQKARQLNDLSIFEPIQQQEYGDSDRQENIPEINTAEQQRIKKVLKRYQQTYGKQKLQEELGIKPPSRARSIARSAARSIASSQRSFSVCSDGSTLSTKEARLKLEKLQEEQNRIQKEKQDLMNYLETKTHTSRASSRQTTVSYLYNQKPKVQEASERGSENPYIRRTQPIKVSQPEPQKKVTETKTERHRPMSEDEVGDLIRNLQKGLRI